MTDYTGKVVFHTLGELEEYEHIIIDATATPLAVYFSEKYKIGQGKNECSRVDSAFICYNFPT
jgi:hypothetical protein